MPKGNSISSMTLISDVMRRKAVYRRLSKNPGSHIWWIANLYCLARVTNLLNYATLSPCPVITVRNTNFFG